MLTSKKILIRQNKPLARLKNFDILHGVSYKKDPYKLAVSTGTVSCYPASMVNLIWFANEKCLSYQHWATCRHEIRCLAIQTQPPCKLGVL